MSVEANAVPNTNALGACGPIHRGQARQPSVGASLCLFDQLHKARVSDGEKHSD